MADSQSDRDETVQMLQRNWAAEMHGARMYRELAEAEKNERRKAVLVRMAEAEERHAARWQAKLAELGAKPLELGDSLFAKLRRRMMRIGGTAAAIGRMEATEDRDIARYADQQKKLAERDPQVQQLFHDVELEERAHARALGAMQEEDAGGTSAASGGPRGQLDRILGREKWHGRGGGWISDAVYGVNDGLGAVFGIVAGVAGATNNQQHAVLIAGLAGMIASALSMGAGAYLAVKSETEVHEAELAREQRELEENPDEEREEMSLFYQLQGFSEQDANSMAEKLAQDPEQMMRVMAQNELGISTEHFRNPWVSGFSAMTSTAVGAFVPIVPFFFMGGTRAVVLAFGISLIAHFLVGAAKSLITNRGAIASGVEMTMVGVLEAAVTYGLGKGFAAVA